MKHADFLNKWLGSSYREMGIQTFECVALAKLYTQECNNIKLGSFGGSAWNGFLNEQHTFDDSWEQTVDKSRIRQGALLFFKPTSTNQYWHVAVCDSADSMLEQNGGKGSGTGQGTDAIRLSKWNTRKDFAGAWQIKQQPVVESLMPLEDLRAIWLKKKTRKFWNYAVDERIKMLIDISYWD